MNPYIKRKQMIKEIEKKGGEIYFDAELFSKKTIKQKKKDILESIRKIRDDGDKDKLNYVNNLYRYYCFF